MIRTSVAPHQPSVSQQPPAAISKEAELADRRARIANLPSHPAFTAWANDETPDPKGFIAALDLSLEAGDPEIIRLIQDRFPSFDEPGAHTLTPSQVAVVSAFGIKCAVWIDCPHEDLAILKQCLQGPCAIHTLKFSDKADWKFLEGYKQLFQDLPPSVKHVDMAGMGNIQSELAPSLPQTVETISLNGTAGWTANDRKALVEHPGLKSVSIAFVTDHDLADWASAFAQAGRRRPVERGSSIFCGSSVENLRFNCGDYGHNRNFSLKKLNEGIGTLLSADTGIMRLSFDSTYANELKKTFAQVGMSALAPEGQGKRHNHTLQVIEGIPLPPEVEAHLNKNRRALNLAVMVGSAALSHVRAEPGSADDVGPYQPGGFILGTVIQNRFQADPLSHELTRLLTLTYPASKAARDAADGVVNPDINNKG